MDGFIGVIVIFVLHYSSSNGQTTTETEVYSGTPSGQIDNDTESEFPPIVEDVLSTSVDKGMLPVYDFTKFFLDKVIAVNTLTELSKKASEINALHINFLKFMVHLLCVFFGYSLTEHFEANVYFV